MYNFSSFHHTDQTSDAAMRPLHVLLLWALLCLARGNVLGVLEEIFTRPGSDLLLPIRRHLTLSHTDRDKCDKFYWLFRESSGHRIREIARHKDCDLSESKYFPNTKISENGNLIISNVTPENDGMYIVYICNTTGDFIQIDYYPIHVEGNVRSVLEEIFTRPGSDLLLPIRQHLTLNHTERRNCDKFYWFYMESSGQPIIPIAIHYDCDLMGTKHYLNTKISDNGNLIISNVTPKNDGIYIVNTHNTTGKSIQIDYYIVHVEGNVPGVQEEIFTRPGSDLLLPIRLLLTFNRTDIRSCHRLSWYYKESSEHQAREIAKHWYCNLYDFKHFPNTKISEDGSLIISNVTPENDGMYIVTIYNTTGDIIQIDYYTVHVEGNVPGVQEEIFTRPGSDLLLSIRLLLTLNHTDIRSCHRLSWYYKESSEHQAREIAKHWYCNLYDFKHFPNTKISEDGSLIISNVTPENDGMYIVTIYNTTGDLIQIDHYTVHVEGNVPGVQEEIFTRPGSDLLLPIRLLLTFNHTDIRSCHRLSWYYKESSEHQAREIAKHWYCNLYDFKYFPNTKISEDGSLIISNVTPENDGMYIVTIYNTTGDLIQIDYYTVHVEGNVPGVQEEIFTRPGSDLLLPIRLLLTFNRTDIRSCHRLSWYYKESSEHQAREIAKHWYCNLYDFKHFPNTKISEDGSLIISNVTPENDGMYIVTIYNTTGDLIQIDYYTVHVEGNVPGVQEEIFTRPGSDLLLPIRLLLTFNHTDIRSCHRLSWYYKESSEHQAREIAKHWYCNLYDFKHFPNTKISEDGSLIISNVTPENDGMYIVTIYNTTGDLIQIDYYTVHVEGNVPGVHEEIFTRPGSDLLLPIRLLLTFNRTDIRSCHRLSWYYKESSEHQAREIAKHWYCNLYDFKHFPNTKISEDGSLIISNVTPENDGMYIVTIYNTTGDIIQIDYYTVHVEGY
ncbi:cell adhesion molecule CEACAM3-like [Mantella aurantiaca]